MKSDSMPTIQLIDMPAIPADENTWVDCEINVGSKKYKARIQASKIKGEILAAVDAIEFNATIDVNFYYTPYDDV